MDIALVVLVETDIVSNYTTVKGLIRWRGSRLSVTDVRS